MLKIAGSNIARRLGQLVGCIRRSIDGRPFAPFDKPAKSVTPLTFLKNRICISDVKAHSAIGKGWRVKMFINACNFAAKVISSAGAVGLMTALTACAGNSAGDHLDEYLKEPNFIVIEHVTILPMTDRGTRIEDATIVLQNGRIERVGSAAQIDAPNNAQRIDGHGKFLMPGLTDMHVHLQNDGTMRNFYGVSATEIPDGTYQAKDILTPYVANGVLQILNLTSDTSTMEQRDAVERGEVTGPHIVMGVMIDGDPPLQPRGVQRVARNPEEGKQIVRDIKSEEFDVVKTYGRLDQPTFAAIVEQARQLGMPVIGHLPDLGRVPPEEVFIPGFGLLAHAEEIAQVTNNGADGDLSRFVEAAQQNGAGLVSTIVLNRRILEQTRDVSSLRKAPGFAYVHPYDLPIWFQGNRYASRNSPERIARLKGQVAFNDRVVRAFHEAGLTVYPGTDSLIPGLVGGFALHDELEALADAGIPDEVLLLNATSGASRWLGTIDERGTVEEGKVADLILLDKDPTISIVNARRISAVFVRGRYISKAELDENLTDLKNRYSKLPPLELKKARKPSRDSK